MPDRKSSSSNRSRHRDNPTTTPYRSTYTWHYSAQGHDLGPQGHRTPSCRCKHAACYHGNNIYVHGGRNGGVCHRDIWRYHLGSASWVKLQCKGDQPLSPQEHTIVAYKNRLYVFGGQFCYTTDKETPLWILDLDTLVWRKCHIDSEVVTPSGRRGHTAVVYGDTMCIYGGYVDLKGSSNEVWSFHLDHEMWHLSNKWNYIDTTPDGRHSHSAVMYDAAMFVYGGMSDLVPKDDFWRWDFVCCQWNRIKTRPSPPPLKGHTASVVADQMLLYGGASQGAYHNTLWCFHFGTNTWSRMSPYGPLPPPSVQHTAVIVTANNLSVGVEQNRSISHPFLRDEKPIPVNQNRPFSSPPSLTVKDSSSSEGRSSFRNKISPVGSPPKYDSIRIEQDANIAGDERRLIDNQFENDSCGFEKEGSVEPDLVNDVRQAMWRSSGGLSTESVQSDDAPLLDAARSKLMQSESVTSSDFMDTVAGCHVNRIITDVNNLLVRGVSVEGVESLKPLKRQLPLDHTIDPMPKRSTSLEGALDQEDLRENNGLSDLQQIAMQRGCSRSHASDDLKLEDIEDDEMLHVQSYFENTSDGRMMNDSLASYDDVNISNSSETARLMPARQDSAEEELERTTRYNKRSGKHRGVCRVQCFSNPHYKSLSCDSLPYGMSNPVYSLHNLAGSTADQRIACEVESASGAQRKSKANINNNVKGWSHDKPSGKASQTYEPIPTHDSSHCQGAAKGSPDANGAFAMNTAFTNPSYFERPSCKEVIEMTDMSPKKCTSDRKGDYVAIPQKETPTVEAWNGKEKDSKKLESEVIGASRGVDVGMKSERSDHKKAAAALGSTASTSRVLTPPIPLVQPSQFYMFILGGQNTDSKSFGYSPLQMCKLSITLGGK